MNNANKPELLEVCQPGASEQERENEVPRIFVLLYRLRWHIRNKGYWATSKKIARRLILYFRHRDTDATMRKAPPVVRPALGLKAGEFVEVLSEEEIRQTLDHTGRDRGLSFMSEMRAYCGRRFRVMKPVKNIMVDEFASTARLRSVKDAVLLEGAICHGAGVECDRSCFFFWKESWLKRVDDQQRVDESKVVIEGSEDAQHQHRAIDLGSFGF